MSEVRIEDKTNDNDSDLTFDDLTGFIKGQLQKKYETYADHVKKGHWGRLTLEIGGDVLGLTAVTGKKSNISRAVRAGGAGAIHAVVVHADKRGSRTKEQVNTDLVKSGAFPVVAGEAVIPPIMSANQTKALTDAGADARKSAESAKAVLASADSSVQAWLRAMVVMSKVPIIDSEGRTRRRSFREALELGFAGTCASNAFAQALVSGRLDQLLRELEANREFLTAFSEL